MNSSSQEEASRHLVHAKMHFDEGLSTRHKAGQEVPPSHLGSTENARTAAATNRGVLVVSPAGNEGILSSATNLAPWMLIVAASSTDRDFTSVIMLENGAKVTGESLSLFEMNASSRIISALQAFVGYFMPYQSIEAKEINVGALKRLVARSPNLKSLRLNRYVPAIALQRILVRAPQMADLGIGSFIHDLNSEAYIKLKNTILRCRSITSLSVFLEVDPFGLTVVYPICRNITSLNLKLCIVTPEESCDYHSLASNATSAL
ncbi:hypothetical protein KIW84_075568 [Lathyrus oleraceus]|uniref:Uncharacterized protein n=1 Tax=Pisum sativum TaxID=3888 RepID=A0A9D4ZZM7_PEA|nr:hypothetical protein KIW84_075568 [Pisum sativum]